MLLVARNASVERASFTAESEPERVVAPFAEETVAAPAAPILREPPVACRVTVTVAESVSDTLTPAIAVSLPRVTTAADGLETKVGAAATSASHVTVLSCVTESPSIAVMLIVT